jgi:putative heme-binding domain-containing protein
MCENQRTLSNDIFCLTLDPKGRVVVSGPGYVRLLLDTDGDGKADRAFDFPGAPKDGAMGLFWESQTLFCMGDGGLRRYRLSTDGRAEGPPELLRKFRTGTEHGAHAIRRGPDGWLYVLCGNNADVNASFVTLPTSPIRTPTAGCVLRFKPESKDCEIVADGFRNPYGMDFGRDGELFTFDSDNERCVSLPWYEGTRFYHVVPGGHYGWQSPQRAQTWRQPPYFLDVVPPLVDLGRGSPTGVVCYRHVQFPPHYRGGFFLLDWTFGRIYFVRLKPAGSSYTAEAEVFLQAEGDNGFAPTAAAVHPVTGDLYVSIGGRGTRGAVYRIRFPKGLPGVKREDVARLQPPARSLDWQEGSAADWLDRATGKDLADRRRALAYLRRHQDHFTPAQMEKAVRANWGHSDRLLRQATAALLETLDDDASQRIANNVANGNEATTFGLARVESDPGAVCAILIRLRLLSDAHISVPTRLEAVRLLQRALGDLSARKANGTVWEGYSRRRETFALPEELRLELRKAFPSENGNLDRELSRTLAMIEEEKLDLLRQVAARLTADSNPLDDIHYLIVLARLRGSRPEEITKRVADALQALDRKITARHLNRDRNWPLRVAELHAELAQKDSALNAALLAHPEFGRPDHALFAECPGFDRRRAAERFLARADRDPDFTWNAALITLLGSLPDAQARPVLRSLWGKVGLDETILPLLARQPENVDRARFVQGLSSPQLATIRLCLDALEKLGRRDDKEELLALILALRRLPAGKEEDKLRARLVDHLQRATGQTQPGSSGDAWAEWYARKYPDRAARLAGPDGVDVAGWERRLEKLDWSIGDLERGRRVFVQASCASCHSGTQALGPDLRGVGGRFSRADLFTAILQPSKDVAQRYRTTQIVTADGKVYQGLIIYEAVDSVLLQTGPATTQRLANPQISERRLTATSLMPAGLLDRLGDREIADLYAYLKGLK